MTLYIVQKSGNQNPKLCDFGDIQAGDMVFAGGVSIIVGALNEQNQKMHKASLKQRMAADKDRRAS